MSNLWIVQDNLHLPDGMQTPIFISGILNGIFSPNKIKIK